MGRVFLGKPVHWAGIAAAALGLYLVGLERLHVTWFNAFTGVVALVAVALVVIVLATTRRGEQVTRDPIPEPHDDAE